MKCYSCIKCSVWFVVFVFFRYSSRFFLKFSHCSFWGPHITVLLVTPPFRERAPPCCLAFCALRFCGSRRTASSRDLNSRSLKRAEWLSPKMYFKVFLEVSQNVSKCLPCLTAPSKSPRSAWHLSEHSRFCLFMYSFTRLCHSNSFYNVLMSLKLFSYPFEALVQAGEATSLEANHEDFKE